MYDRYDVKENAKTILRQNRGISVGIVVLYGVLIGVVGFVSFGLGDIFLAPPLYVGLCMFMLQLWRGEGRGFDVLFEGFAHYTQALIGILWMYLWTFLWSLLFLIPGIVKALSYSMTPYLLADYPLLSPRKALRVSMAITKGRKPEIFVMYLSFIGWLLLTPFTFGILYVLHVGPYMQLSYAGMYEAMLQDALDEGRVTKDDLNGSDMGVVI